MFTLPSLPFETDALAPDMSEATLRVHHGGHRAQRKVAMAARVLGEAERLPRDRARKAHGFDQLVCAPRGAQQPSEEVVRGHLASAARTAQMHRALERHQAQRQLGRGIGVRDGAAHRAAIADLKVGDEGKGQRQQGRHLGVGLQLGLGDRRTHAHRIGLHHDGGQLCAARDVDQQGRLGQPHVKHRHERLPARQNARTFAMALQQRGRLLGAVGTHIVKHGRFHERTPRRCKSRCHHDARAATPPEACRPSDSKSCATMSRAALSSMRLPTMATLPPTWAL